MSYKVNNVLQFRWNSDGDFVGQSYAEGKQEFAVEDPSLLRVLESLPGPVSRDEAIDVIESTVETTRDAATETFETLVEREVLLPEGHRNFTESDDWFDKSWRRALYYNLGTRNAGVAEGDADPESARREPLAEYAADPSAPDVFGSFDEQVLHELPSPEELPDRSLDDVLTSRKTSRSFKSNPVGIQDVSTLLYHAFSPVRELRENLADYADSDQLDRTDCMMHLAYDVYVLVARCEDLETGVYRYSIRDHALSPVRTDLVDGAAADEAVTDTIIGQEWNHGSAFTTYFVARFDRARWLYRHSRGLRMLFMDVPTQAQRLILTATAMNLNNFLTPALRNEFVDELLDVDGYDAAAIYTVTVGD